MHTRQMKQKSLLDRLIDVLKGIFCFIKGTSESTRRHDVRPLARMGVRGANGEATNHLPL